MTGRKKRWERIELHYSDQTGEKKPQWMSYTEILQQTRKEAQIAKLNAKDWRI